MKKTLKIIITLLVYALLTYLVMTGVYYSSTYPSGSDTMFHVYRGNLLYHSIQEGNWFPMLDPDWYNGAEIMRYWAPFPAYVLAFFQFAAGGNAFDGYILFVGMMFYLGAVSWLIIGVSRNRIGMGAFIGGLWFFMPNNLLALFVEGNLARTICMIFLPLFVHYMHGYLYESKWNSLWKMMICCLFMVLCHLGYAGMIFLAVLVYLICYSILYHDIKKTVHVILGIAISFLWVGIWIIPSLKGGITSTDSSQVMAMFFQSAAVSLNPLRRIKYGMVDFYFGLAAFVLAVFGVLFSKRKSEAGFISAVLIFFCTTTAMYPFISRLPGSQYLWMLRFISIALCFILFSFFLWDTLKKPLVVFMCALLVLDTIPSFPLIYGDVAGKPVEERMDEFAEDTLIAQAKEITTQRMALIDASRLGATGAYAVSSYKTTTAATFGAGWQGANTASNIVQLNQAVNDGHYVYLFDRCLELGNDTVLVAISELQYEEDDIEELDKAAELVGYSFVKANDEYRLYHIDTYPSFGLVTEYQAIGIGSNAESFCMLYPTLGKGASNNLNDYSFEQLSQYQLIYLDGFTYTNREKAEQLLVQLSEAGVRIVISADRIPIDEHTGVQKFLGVNCYNIRFSNGYPVLDTIEGRLDLDLFASGYSDWKTVYMEGLDECWGYMEDKGEQLDFYGTVINENIVFIALNLPFHCELTKDAYGLRLLAHAMSPALDSDVPERQIVPVKVEYSGNRICIQTEYDNVNTCLAFHDTFDSEQKIWKINNLTYVNSGTTEISMHYPYLWQGLSVSVAGIIAAVLLLIWTKKQLKVMDHHVVEDKTEDNVVTQREYQFKFFLNASHSMNMNGSLGQKHSHTWEIAITMKQIEDGFVQFHDAEQDIVTFLSAFQDKYLNEIPPFDKQNPTLENITDFFEKEISELTKNRGWLLLKTVISENPTRAYVIDAATTQEEEEESPEKALKQKTEIESILNEEAAITAESPKETAAEKKEEKPKAEPKIQPEQSKKPLKKPKLKNTTKISVVLPVKKKEEVPSKEVVNRKKVTEHSLNRKKKQSYLRKKLK